jgi:ribosome-binding protein aMBF1 (putative translation factor)
VVRKDREGSSHLTSAAVDGFAQHRIRMSEEKRFFSREELAKRWEVSWRTIRRMEQDGRLPGVIYISDRIVRIPAEVVEKCERGAAR